jgi:hypothetical protein
MEHQESTARRGQATRYPVAPAKHDFQEFRIAPVGAPSFQEAMCWAAECYLKRLD